MLSLFDHAVWFGFSPSTNLKASVKSQKPTVKMACNHFGPKNLQLLATDKVMVTDRSVTKAMDL